MKILLVGQFKNWAIENHFAHYLQPHAEVATYAAEDIFDTLYRRSTWSKIQFRLGFSKIYEKIACELLDTAEQEKPDVIWVFKGMRILPQTLRELKNRGFKIANYNPDHPFQFSSAGSGNSNVTQSIGLYDLHFCYSRAVQRRIEQECGIPTAFLPFGFELPGEVFEEVKNEPEILSACFIGNPDEIRVAQLHFLADNGVPLAVFGHGWERHFSKNSAVQIHEAVYGKAFWQKMRAYRLQINIFRPHNEGSHNMRTFEPPAVGGIQLAPDSPEHREFFEPEREIFLYKTKEEMLAQAKKILAMSGEAAAAIRRRAREKSLAAGFSYEGRATTALEAFCQLVENEALAHPSLRTSSF